MLAQTSRADVVRAAGSSLVLSDSAAADKCYVSSHTLSLSDEATVNFIKRVGAHDDPAVTL